MGLLDDLFPQRLPRAEAAFEGNCPGCGVMINQGDVIGLVDEDWVCEDCADKAEDNW